MKKNVRLFGVMTKTSILSDKNVPLKKLKTSKPFWMQREGKMSRPSELHSTLNRKKADPTLLEYETR